MIAVFSVAGSLGTVSGSRSKYRLARSAGSDSVDQAAGYESVPRPVPSVASRSHVETVGTMIGGTLGAGVGAGVALGASVGAVVGFAVADGLGVAVGSAVSVRDGFSVGSALGDGDGAASGCGRASDTVIEPFRSVSTIWSARRSRNDVPSRAVRNAVSTAVAVSSHATFVVASRLMRT